MFVILHLQFCPIKKKMVATLYFISHFIRLWCQRSLRKEEKKFYKILSNVRQLSFIQMLLYVEHLSQCLLNFLTYTLKEINSAFYSNYITNEKPSNSYIILLFYLIWWISLRLNSMNRSHFYFLLILRNTGYKSKGMDVIRSKILKLISG